MDFCDEKVPSWGKAIVDAGCPAARSLDKALRRAVGIISLEFRTPDDPRPPVGGDCSSLRAWWNEWTTVCLERHINQGRRYHRLGMMVKSCKRLFDVSCEPCDSKLSMEARRKWDAHVALDVPTEAGPSQSDLSELSRKVREMICGWDRRLKERRDSGEEPVLGEYVPDQQGCYETERKFGGTLATGVSDYSGDWSLLRRGVAKQKGKFRVVTMQSAEVKRVLTPVHNSLYDHITSFGWCVRGDVRKEDFESVRSDLRGGELFISGDYQSATDNIYLAAVDVMVDEISRSPLLTGLERDVLLGSFRDLRWRSRSGVVHPIKRGQMMGNLISFPLLCLLNKACFDIACDIRDRSDRSRVGRFNGDDCMFCGDDAFFREWSSVTARYGFIVNREKTGRSRRWLELNSQVYDGARHSLVSKPVLGFLRPGRQEPGSMLCAVTRGVSSFSRGHRLMIVNLLRYEISLRGVLEDLGSLGPWWRAQLAKKRWFRAAAMLGGAQVTRKGVARGVTVRVAAPPRPRFFSFVSRAAARLQRDNTEKWIGKRVVPLEEKLDRRTYRKSNKGMTSPLALRRFSWCGFRWAFVWPVELYKAYNHLPIFGATNSKWYDHHPFLTRRPCVVEVKGPRKDFPPPVSLLYGADNLPNLL